MLWLSDRTLVHDIHIRSFPLFFFLFVSVFMLLLSRFGHLKIAFSVQLWLYIHILRLHSICTNLFLFFFFASHPLIYIYPHLSNVPKYSIYMCTLYLERKFFEDGIKHTLRCAYITVIPYKSYVCSSCPNRFI